jgi:hypothetical protein
MKNLLKYLVTEIKMLVQFVILVDVVSGILNFILKEFQYILILINK